VASIFVPSAAVALASITFAIDILGKTGLKQEINAEALSESFKTQFVNQVFLMNQQMVMDFTGIKLDMVVDSFDHANIADSASAQPPFKSNYGQVAPVTNIIFKKMGSSQNQITLTGVKGPMRNDSLFRNDFNFESIGIGGLDEQFQKLIRKAFATRMFPGLVKELGANHVRGILLFGPPGCGKTLIARQIGKILNSREPKIVNGPEILDKYVGGSEEKVRELFADAEKEQAEAGDNSMLHIIIFDEMDAIMKQRGSTRDNTGVGDSVVNQLLSKIDGVDSLNNILIIGMTNRKDLIDEAILRPGRLEVHIEITLPDEKGRLQILKIKTSDMRKNRRITEEALTRLPELAHMTKNFTGAELEGLVRNAVSFALSRNIDGSSLKGLNDNNIQVEWRDFERAIGETTPAFGNRDNDELQQCYSNGVYSFGKSFEDSWEALQRFCNQVKNSARTPLMSVLLEGGRGTGKTAIAAKIAMESDFPFIRMITADSMIGASENTKCSNLLKVFSDSYRSPLSVIIIDDIERIMDYTPVGPRFSNMVLQTLLVLIKKIPPTNCRLLVIATTSIASYMEDVQVTRAFNVVTHVNELKTSQEVYTVLGQYPDIDTADARNIANSIIEPIGIKQLMMVLEMARDESTGKISPDNFIECLHTIGY
jgi:vesicle-fusing ATPase